MKNIKIVSSVIAAIIVMVFSGAASATLSVTGTRVIVNDNQPTNVVVRNVDKAKPFLAQTWVENKENQIDREFFVVQPPLQRLEPDTRTQILIRPTAVTGKLPQDQESLFYFNVKEIPPKMEQGISAIQIALQTRIKLFYRPAAIGKAHPAGPNYSELRLSEVNGSIKVENPTPFHVTVSEVRIGNKVLNEGLGDMLAPYSSNTLPGTLKSNDVTLVVINDFGGMQDVNFRCTAGHCASITQEG
ncbi:fimbrial biogenesis chaperone [Aeromonas sp. A600556]|uniref:fimbrial biogenesis chaperone n=1 Tax=Aeromonas sp. A600556 TaxID=2712058 RepID=UPI003F8C178C